MSSENLRGILEQSHGLMVEDIRTKPTKETGCREPHTIYDVIVIGENGRSRQLLRSHLAGTSFSLCGQFDVSGPHAVRWLETFTREDTPLSEVAEKLADVRLSRGDIVLLDRPKETFCLYPATDDKSSS